MRPINLIPPEERRGERAPLRAGALSYLIVGVLLLGFLAIYVVVSTGNSISEHEAEVAGLEQQLASSQAKADALQSFSNFASLEQTRTQTVSDLARSRFDWERVLEELALVIPTDVTLDSLTGSTSGASGAGDDSGGDGGAAAQTINAPTLAMSGCADSHDAVAGLIASLRDIDGVTRVGLSNSTKGGGEDGAAPAPSPVESGGGEGGGCVRPIRFELIVAFDGVSVDPASGGVLPPSEPAPTPGDGSGVAEAEAEHQAAQDSVDSAQDRANQAVDNYVPGA